MKDLYFSVQTRLKTIVSITPQYWEYIVTYKHTNMRGREQLVKDTLSVPISIKYSKKDRDVVLYYKEQEDKYCCVVVRNEKLNGFIITCYITDKIKSGEIVWQK